MSINRNSISKKFMAIIDLMWPYFILVAVIMFFAQWDGALIIMSFFVVPVYVLLLWVSPLIIIYFWQKIWGRKLTILNVRICTALILLISLFFLVNGFFDTNYSNEGRSHILGTIVAVLILHRIVIRYMGKADANVDNVD